MQTAVRFFFYGLLYAPVSHYYYVVLGKVFAGKTGALWAVIKVCGAARGASGGGGGLPHASQRGASQGW